MKQSRPRTPRRGAVPTQHNDPGRTGHNSHVHGLDWTTVGSDSFGKLFNLAVDGFVFAQPLFIPGVPTAARGSCDLLIVVTMRNVVYAFDANAKSADNALVWRRQVGLLPAVPSNAFGLRYNDMYHAEVGILSTPAVDQKALRLYLVAMSFDAHLFNETPEDAFAHHLYALDLRDGSDAGPAPKRFEGEVKGNGYLAPNSIGMARVQDDVIVFDNAIPVDWIAATASPTSDDDVQTTRLWPIRDGKYVNSEPFVVFNSMMQLQRPGLLLHDRCIFSAFGSHGDADPYHGWIFAHDVETLEQNGLFCTTANGTRAGIWQAGEGLVADRKGYVYAGTGNGDTNIDLGNYGECLLRLKHGKNGLELHGVANVFEDKIGGDDDFGASSPTLLDDDRMIGGGKDGNFFLFDPDVMEKDNTDRSLEQIFLASYDSKTFFNEQATHHIHGPPSSSKVFRLFWSMCGAKTTICGVTAMMLSHTVFPDSPTSATCPASL